MQQFLELIVFQEVLEQISVAQRLSEEKTLQQILFSASGLQQLLIGSSIHFALKFLNFKIRITPKMFVKQ